MVFSRPGLACLALVCLQICEASRAEAQQSTQIKPYFLVIVDNSGSMDTSTGAGTNSCGQTRTRFNDAKCVLQQITNAYGDVVFGLMRFRQTTSGSCNCSENHLDCGACNENNGNGCPSTGDDADQGEMLVPIVDDNQQDILNWVNFTCGTCTKVTANNPELKSGTWTPIGGALLGAKRYYESNDPDFSTSPIEIDPYNDCRPYYVILLTDGDESCQRTSTSLAVPTQLRSTVVGGVTYDVRTFAIGFGMAGPDNEIETYALNGGTDAPGPNRGFYASDETTLAQAFADIIQDSQLVEVCDGVDNNCDGVADEGFPVGDPCDGPDLDLCPEGVLVCNGTGDGVVCTDDTGTDVEVCNGADDDCDGLVDEPPADCGGCVSQPEICNGVDDDCDGRIDEGITRVCGADVGVCTAGVQDCIEQTAPQPAGEWGPCSGVGPSPESCDGLDNDCDGVVDGMIEACGNPPVGQCQPGTSLCTDGMWGPCIGEVGPGMEGCDGFDNDCDGVIDDGDPGGGQPCGTTCGVGVTECIDGELVCTGGGTGMPEECNGLDDDCDGQIDEGLGPMGPCDEGGTLCVPGQLECQGAAGYVCVGGTPPEQETCDCLDNDCDGTADDPDPGPLCAPGSTCLAGPWCQCARPCEDSEFPCPEGRICTNPDDPANGFCVTDPCWQVVCDPDPMTGEPRTCVDGDCLTLCETVTCTAPLVCRPSDGLCVEDNCNGFPERCDAGEFCVDGVCEVDACATVTCPDPETYCLDGACVDSCGPVDCPAGQTCRLGVCEDDPCAEVDCPDFQVCDPVTADCRQDTCIGVVCPPGMVCNPHTGDCERDPCLGVECPGDEVCREGSCYDPGDLPGAPDAGVPPDNTYVSAGGAGGCSCEVGGGRGGARGAGVVVIAALALLVVRRRRLPRSARAGGGGAPRRSPRG